MTIEEFLSARIDDAMEHFKKTTNDSLALISYSNMVANMRYAIEWHKNFPVLVTSPPQFDIVEKGVEGIPELAYRMSQEIEWQTQEEYRKKFGAEPPTAPLLLAWVQQFAYHADFQEEWLLDDSTHDR
jgi:hypothetical protein